MGKKLYMITLHTSSQVEPCRRANIWSGTESRTNTLGILHLCFPQQTGRDPGSFRSQGCITCLPRANKKYTKHVEATTSVQEAAPSVTGRASGAVASPDLSSSNLFRV